MEVCLIDMVVAKSWTWQFVETAVRRSVNSLTLKDAKRLLIRIPFS
jgi:hypothetical protein